MIKLIGYPVSPFVRKVRLLLEYKQLPYQLDPLNPFTEQSRVQPLNPDGKVPVLEDKGALYCNSRDICLYLDNTYHHNFAYPTASATRERALELEAFADNKLAEVFFHHLFKQLVIRPHFLGEGADEQLVKTTLTQEIPAVLAQLEELMPDTGFIMGSLSIVDISIASQLRSGLLAGATLEASHYPKVAAWYQLCCESAPFRTVIAAEEELELVQILRQQHVA